ncbi:serine hydrolase domain-containing protein [Nonomuraea sp. NPDC050394]|uniref:serine hydrolase domain-containing protein n=1 Tax=Nonomuraea sp. NPDC050394 TaxID=3364363 RepID=UPI0037BC1055
MRTPMVITALTGAFLLSAMGTASADDNLGIDSYVRDYVERTGLPGAMVAVTKGDKVVLTAGYGHTAGGDAITKDTPMPLASVSKSFTALAVTKLAEEGKVKLDAPVRQYLPEFTMADPRAAKITVRQLLHQTSGMSDRSFPELTLDAPATLKDAVAMLRTAGLSAEPGARMYYHNPNYSLLGRLVEVVARRPFAEHMAAGVFRPLGMNATKTVDSSLELPGAAKGYVRAYGRTVPRSHPEWFVNGGYGVVSTADDMARWLIAQNGDRPAIKATHQGSGVGESTYAMGWYTGRTASGAPMLKHTGWLLTHNAVQVLLPGSGYGIAVVTNTGMMSGDDAAIIADGLIDLAEGRPDRQLAPFTSSADPILAGMTLLTLALGALGVYRARTWARRRSGRATWRLVVRLAPYALPVALFAGLAELFGLLMNRSGTLAQISYVWPALFVWTATAALTALAVAGTRIFHTIRARRRTVTFTG